MISTLLNKYSLKKMDKDNAKEILELYESNPEYFEYCPPSPSIEGIIEELHELPPDTEKDNKYYLGIYDHDKLIGVIDLITNYPNEETAFIGLFMLHGNLQNKGLGSKLIEDFLQKLKNENYIYCRLAYIVGNTKAQNFWTNHQFKPIKQTKSSNCNNLDVILTERKL